MKKLALSLIATGIVLSSCGGGEGGSSDAKSNVIKTEIKSSNERFKGFEQRGTLAYYGGMQWSGGAYQKVLNIAITNYDTVGVSSFGAINMPSKDGDYAIVVSIYGEKGTEAKQLIPLTKGKYTTNEDEKGKSFKVNVYANVEGKSTAETFSGEKYAQSNKINGEVELTEVSDTKVKGTVKYTVEGGHELSVNFDAAIDGDYWKVYE